MNSCRWRLWEEDPYVHERAVQTSKGEVRFTTWRNTCFVSENKSQDSTSWSFMNQRVSSGLGIYCVASMRAGLVNSGAIWKKSSFPCQESFRCEFNRERVVSVSSGKRRISQGVRGGKWRIGHGRVVLWESEDSTKEEEWREDHCCNTI